MFVNGATFLLVTILSVPAIAETANYLEYIGVVVVSSIFIGASAWLPNRLGMTRSKELPSNQ